MRLRAPRIRDWHSSPTQAPPEVSIISHAQPFPVTPGIVEEGKWPRLRLNPGCAQLPRGCQVLVIGQSEVEVCEALQRPYFGRPSPRGRGAMGAAKPRQAPVASPGEAAAHAAPSGAPAPPDPSPAPSGNECSSPEGCSVVEAVKRTALTEHIILAGSEPSFCPFVRYLRRACSDPHTPIVVLHPTRPLELCEGGVEEAGPVQWVQGSAAEPWALSAAGAGRARALVYLAKDTRPVRSAQATGALRVCRGEGDPRRSALRVDRGVSGGRRGDAAI